MSISVNPPELVISLSRDKVRFQLLAQPEVNSAEWLAVFPIQGDFLEDQIANAFDAALTMNPSLIDHFEHVEIIVLDRPNIFIPSRLLHNGKMSEIASRYLRVRAGDVLTSDHTIRDTVFAYSLPLDTLNLVREYYSNVAHLHISSILWNALSNLEDASSGEGTRQYFFSMGNTLICLGAKEGKLSYARSFYVQDEKDVLYFSIACSRLFAADENWFITIRNEAPTFDMAESSFFKFSQRYELPELRTLISQYRLCAS